MPLPKPIKKFIKRVTPPPIFDNAKKFQFFILKHKYRHFGRPVTNFETHKARERRTREGFFKKFCNGKGLDIGFGGDLLCDNCRGWDYEHGDAQYLMGIDDEQFDFVYSGHTLEHMVDPAVSLINWWRVLKIGGYLMIYIPHRDLFEKKKTLPSHWNYDHKSFFLLDKDEAPDTIGVIPLIERTLDGYKMIYAKVCDEGFAVDDPLLHSQGEYSIELVLKKL